MKKNITLSDEVCIYFVILWGNVFPCGYLAYKTCQVYFKKWC